MQGIQNMVVNFTLVHRSSWKYIFIKKKLYLMLFILININ